MLCWFTPIRKMHVFFKKFHSNSTMQRYMKHFMYYLKLTIELANAPAPAGTSPPVLSLNLLNMISILTLT
jgi:hypothetical protein